MQSVGAADGRGEVARRGGVGGVVVGNGREGLDRPIGVPAPLRLDLAESEADLRELPAVHRERGRGHPMLVERDDFVPVPGEEVVLFEGLEGLIVARSRPEALAVAV